MHRLRLMFASFPPLLAFRFAVVYIAKYLLNSHASINYSQTGEDAMIRSLLDETTPGVYVDVGCHDPIKWSNTLSLYMHGWRGVNIDANPKLIKRFREARRRDVAVCAAISDRELNVEFHEFENDLVSTVEPKVLREWEHKWAKCGTRMLRTRTLDSVLKDTLEPGTEIGLLSVDVEGHDLNVLRSVDLDLFRPRLIVVEVHHFEMHKMTSDPVTVYLESCGFKQVGYDTLNGYFVDVRSKRSGLSLP